jgi:hypothetical protein
MTIRDTLIKYRSLVNHKGEIGLEIETETLDQYVIPEFALWDHHADDSLRNVGREYILKRPLVMKEFKLALKEFETKTKGIKFLTPAETFTTSVHTHLNIQHDNFQTFGNFLTIYSLVENFLVRFAGANRRSNLFCLPIIDAEVTFENIMKMMVNIEKKNFNSMIWPEDTTKYGALNLYAIGQYGSFEIRLLEGTTDVERIENWVELLFSIMKYSRNKELTPPQFIKQFRDKGPKLLDDIFGERRKLIQFDKNVEDDLLDSNLWYASSIASSVKDWTKLDPQVKPRKLTSADLDKWAQYLYRRDYDALAEAEKRRLLEVVKENNYGMPGEEEQEEEQVTWDRPLRTAAAQRTAERMGIIANTVPLPPRAEPEDDF